VNPFEHEPDLAQAQTPPADWYFDPAVLELEQRTVFARAWQLAGRSEQLREPGDFVTCTVGGEPVLITRGADGSLHALSNVCRHRAGAVARGCGRRKALQCTYHGWTYTLDGRLRQAPELEGVSGFDPGKVCLPAFEAEVWGPFVFVRLEPGGPSLHEMLGSIPDETARWPLERLRLYRSADYEVQCNWKVYVDNFLEGYHIPLVHPGLFREIDYGAYRVETGRYHSKQHAPLRAGNDESVYRRPASTGAGELQALYYWVFPNLMLNVYPDNLQTNLILPLGPERTLTRFEWYVVEPERPGLDEDFQGSFAFSDSVQAEDIAVCEDVQRGLRSRHYRAGRYSVRRENGVHHFHGLLWRFLQGEAH
jgi:choline monooxygenase